MKHVFLLFTLVFGQMLFAQSDGIYCSRAHGAPIFRGSVPDDLRSDTFDILNTSIHLDFTNSVNQVISGYSRLTVEALQSNLLSLRLDFEGLTVSQVELNGSAVSFDHNGATLRVDFPSAMSTGDTASVKVVYSGTPIQDATGWGGFYFQGNYVWNLGVGFAADPHSYGRVWFPCFDNFVERSTYDFHIQVSDDLRAACNGSLTGMDTAGGVATFHWLLDQPAPSYLICVAVADYEVVEWIHNGNSADYPVMLHAMAQDTTNLKNSFLHLDDAISTFENSYGDYAWNKVGYSLVPFGSGAMEHVTNITYPIYAANGQLDQESLMAHELGHMWWGDLVTCETDGDMWINEGWASFSEFLVEEQVYGRNEYEQAMLEDLRYMLQFGHHLEGGQYRAVAGQPHEYVYGDHVYKKGALVAHNLRGYLGDAVFFDAITAFLNQNAMSAVSSEDFRDFLTQYTGKDMTDFFHDWVFNPGYAVTILNKFESQSVTGGFEVSMYAQQKLKGTKEFHKEVPVYYTVYGSDFQRFEGQSSISSEYALLTDTVPFEPAWVVFYEQNELAMAQTSTQMMITGIQGEQNLPNAFLTEFEITGLDADSALLRIDHVWSYPTALEATDKPYQLSNYRYWNVTGINLESVSMKTALFYDGRSVGGGTGYLDIDLMNQSEDSLILLHRANVDSDWEEYEDYEKNMIGNPNDGFGRIVISDLREGQYVLGNINSEVLGVPATTSASSVRVYPNPVNDRLIIESVFLPNSRVVVVDSSGREVFSERMTGQKVTLQTNKWQTGTYLVTVSTESGQTLKEKVLIAR